MKITCPNCSKNLQVPDDWVGRNVRCPACKSGVTIPANAEASPADGKSLDLGSLAAIESAGEAVVQERKGKRMTLKEAQAAAAPEEKPKPKDPRDRICPGCGQKATSDDIYVELMCKHCGAGIPGAQLQNVEKAKYTGGLTGRMTSDVSFYTGFTSAFMYPVPAMASILLGMGIALAAIALPLLAVLAFTGGASLNPINEATDFSWVGLFLTVMFVAEGIYFGSVGYFVLIDSIRTTTAGSEQPPTLTWNIINLGSALAGYAALIAFYAVIILLMMAAAGNGLPTRTDDFTVLTRPLNLILLAVLTFSVPMNMIGLASSHALDGLNPIRVFRSLGKVVGHYIFLFLITVLYLGMYIGVMYAVMSWAGPQIMSAAKEGIGAGFVNMLLGILAWSVVMGAGFFFAYSIGRVLGLFARTYREDLEFEL